MSLAVQKLSLVNRKAQDDKTFCIFTLVKSWAGHGCWRSHKQVTRIGGTINSIWIHYILHHYAQTPSHKCKSMIKVGLHLCLLPGWSSRLEYKFNCFITIWKSEVRNQPDQTSWGEFTIIWNTPICRPSFGNMIVGLYVVRFPKWLESHLPDVEVGEPP